MIKDQKVSKLCENNCSPYHELLPSPYYVLLFPKKVNASFKVPMFFYMLLDITRKSVVICLTKEIKINHYFHDNLIPLVKGKIKFNFFCLFSHVIIHKFWSSKFGSCLEKIPLGKNTPTNIEFFKSPLLTSY